MTQFADAASTDAQFRQAMVDEMRSRGDLTEDKIADTFLAVPRHHFLPEIPLEKAYKNDAIPTKFNEKGHSISSSSQPSIMAIMLEQLELEPGHRVLEVGAGTGFNAALMAQLVGETGHVTTIDLDQDTVDFASANLQRAGVNNVTVICADGMDGYATNAPYDRIILTVGGWEIAPAWKEQMAENGRLLLPISFNGPQYSIAFAWQDGCLVSQSVVACGFMRLRGPNAGRDRVQTIVGDTESGIFFLYEQDDDLDDPDAAQVTQWLKHPHDPIDTHLEATTPFVMRTLSLWLAQHEPNTTFIDIRGEMTDWPDLPTLRQGTVPFRWRLSMGVRTEDSVAFLSRPPGEPIPEESPKVPDPPPFPVHVLGYGPGKTAVTRLHQHLQNWDKAGRPSMKNKQIRAIPIAEKIPVDTAAISRRWHTFLFEEQDAKDA